MPRSKTGNHRQAVNKEALAKAIEPVTAAGDQKKSLREACCVYGVKLATLVSRLKTFKLNQDERFVYRSKLVNKLVFSPEEEEELLVNYIDKIARIQYGLTKTGHQRISL